MVLQKRVVSRLWPGYNAVCHISADRSSAQGKLVQGIIKQGG